MRAVGLVATVLLAFILAAPGVAADPPGGDPFPTPEPPNEPASVPGYTMSFIAAVENWVKRSADDGECFDVAISNGPYPWWEPIGYGEESFEGGTRYFAWAFQTVYTVVQYDECEPVGADPEEFPFP